MKIKVLWSAHRIKIIVLAILLLVGGYYAYTKLNNKSATVQYLTATVSKQTIVVSVAGTGQIAASSQVDIKPDVSSKLISLNVKNGDQVKSGQVLAQFDATDALKAVRDAETNLETAQLNLDKLKQSADELTLIKSANSLSQAKESLVSAQNNLDQDYVDANLTIAGTFLQLPTVINGLQQMFYNSTYETNQWNIDWYANRVLIWDSTVLNYKTDLTNAYNSAQTAYDTNFSQFQALPSTASQTQIETLLQQTYNSTKLISEAIKQASTYLDFIDNVTVAHNTTSPQSMKSDQSTLRTYTSTINSQLSQLFSAINSLDNSKASIVSAQRNVEESTLSLADLKAGPDSLDVRAQEITIQQKQDALLDAKANLADYSVRAPLNGVVTNLDTSLRPGQTVANSTTIASIITPQLIAEITLNEIDVAKIKIGQPVTMTFDAVDSVTMTGKVADIDAIGTVSQGVVSYDVKISFDVENEQIKPGMSVSANIITASKTDVLLVPNSAVKSQGNGNYVEFLENGQPNQQVVTIGLTNDTMTEITQGLSEGDNVITQTITSSTASTTNSSSNSRNSGFGGGGLGGVQVFTSDGPPRD